jgi:hypothetical protein
MNTNTKWKVSIAAFVMVLLLTSCVEVPETIDELIGWQKGWFVYVMPILLDGILVAILTPTIVGLVVVGSKNLIWRRSDAQWVEKYITAFALLTFGCFGLFAIFNLTDLGEMIWPKIGDVPMSFDWVAAQLHWTFPPTGDLNPATAIAGMQVTITLPSIHRNLQVVLMLTYGICLLLDAVRLKIRLLPAALGALIGWLVWPYMFALCVASIAQEFPKNTVEAIATATLNGYNLRFLLFVAVYFFLVQVLPPIALLLGTSVVVFVKTKHDAEEAKNGNSNGSNITSAVTKAAVASAALVEAIHEPEDESYQRRRRRKNRRRRDEGFSGESNTGPEGPDSPEPSNGTTADVSNPPGSMDLNGSDIPMSAHPASDWNPEEYDEFGFPYGDGSFDFFPSENVSHPNVSWDYAQAQKGFRQDKRNFAPLHVLAADQTVSADVIPEPEAESSSVEVLTGDRVENLQAVATVASVAPGQIGAVARITSVILGVLRRRNNR